MSAVGSQRRSTADVEPDAKRRKIRKGTRSCWECKRRKVRCIFASETDQVCKGCHHRGTKCIGQEYPEEVSGAADRGRQMGDRIVRMEGLVEQLVKTVGAVQTATTNATPNPTETSSPSPQPGIPTPLSADSGPTTRAPVVALSQRGPSPEASLTTRESQSRQVSTKPHTVFIPTRISPSNAARYKAISAALCDAYPSSRDLEILGKAGLGSTILFKHLLMTPYPILEKESLVASNELFKLPDPGLHPVIVARRMLRLATSLQYYNSAENPEIESLSQKLPDITKTLADAATRLVTTNDEFLGTIEGLDCVTLEGIYHGNNGNLRRAWLAFRRAMVVCQLMGIHRNHHHQPLKSIEPNIVAYPYFIWFRVVMSDRVLSMMLGLPQGSLDNNIASPAALADDTPLGRLERMHTLICSKILERNESGLIDDYATTEAIDLQLQEAAKQLPARWWLVPNLSKAGDSPEAQFWATIKLLSQIFHHHLLNNLHLPFMLRSSESGQEMASKYDYSKATCITAAREMLTRFVAFRSHNPVAYCGRTVDFYALMAALTLLLAHLDGHRQPKGINLLAHQRLADRAMMEDVLENMESVEKHSADKLSEKSEKLLRHLLDIEAEAAMGHQYRASRVRDTEAAQAGDENVLRIPVPYFGTVIIAPEGVICKPSSLPVQAQTERRTILIGNPDGFCELEETDSFGLLREENSGGTVFPPSSVNQEPEALDDELPPMVQGQSTGPALTPSIDREPEMPATQGHLAPRFPPPVTDVLQQYDYPALTAGADDWTFQGVDLAFFDTLMRGASTAEATGDGDSGWFPQGDWR